MMPAADDNDFMMCMCVRILQSPLPFFFFFYDGIVIFPISFLINNVMDALVHTGE